MTWNYAYTPHIWPSLITVLLLLALYGYVWPRRNQPGASVFAISILLGLCWSIGSVFEYAAVEAAAKIFWVKVQAVWQLPATTAVTCFILEYTWPGRWLTRRNLALLSLAPLLLVLLVVTNDLHHWFWLAFRVNGSILPLRGPAAWFFIAYGFGVVSILNLIALVWLFLRSPQHRWPVAAMVVGQIGMRWLYLLEKASTLRSDLPLEILGIAFVDLMYTVALFGFRLFDPVPMARQAAIEQMQAGMLVLDSQGRLASLNPCAERMLGTPARRVKGKSIRDVLPACPDGILAGAGGTEIELSLPQDTIRHYTLTVSPLRDFRGMEVGRLLLLHDVTGQKQAQAKIIEQQRSLATLQEREQLARELHDSTGQVLGYAGFQLEAVYNLILDGQAALSAGQAADASAHLAEAGTHLTRLSSIVEEAHADVREYILNLRLARSDHRPFFATLRHYLDGYCQNYGIQTEMSVGPGVDEGTFDPGAQLQLFRIIQEALSNARKHSGARCVQVSFETQDSRVRLQIQDNGRGFDPARNGSDGGNHFGLRFMRERAEQIGGRLQVQSAPGEGTRIEVEVPVNGNR